MSRSWLGFRLIRAKELNRLHERIADLQEEFQALAKRLGTAVNDLRDAKDKLAEREQAARPFPAIGARTPAPPAMARELISMADKLVDLAGAPSDPRALRWFERRTEALLALCEVVRIEDSGPLDLRRHEVIASRPAPEEDLVDQIADTIRPGYAWRGSLLRPQQVIAYVDPIRNEDS